MRILAFLIVVARLVAQEPCTIERIAGGGGVLTGVGGPATQAEILQASDTQIGPEGLLYIADAPQDVIWRVQSDGMIELFAGTGVPGSSGDGGPAAAALLDEPRELAFGPDGDLYVLTAGDYRIRRIATDGTIHAFAGSGIGLGSENLYRPGMTASELPLSSGTDLAVGPRGELYVTLPYQHRVVKIEPNGIVAPVAGRSVDGRESGISGDGGPATEALLDSPVDVAADSEGYVYIADSDYPGIRRVRPDGIIETFAGPDRSFFFNLLALAIGPDGLVYFSVGTRIGRLSPTGSQETYVESSAGEFVLGPEGEIYTSRPYQLLRVDPGDASVTVIAGVGTGGGFGDAGPATNARFAAVAGLAVDAAGNAFVADRSLHRVRVIRNDGRLERYAGTGVMGVDADGAPAAESELFRPVDVAVDLAGDLWIADDSSRLRRVGSDGIIQTVAGNGGAFCGTFGEVFPSGCGDGGPATEATVPRPSRLAVGHDGSIWIMDNNSGRRPRVWFRRISPDGIIEAVTPLTVDSSGNVASGVAMGIDPQGRLLVFARGPRLQEVFFAFDTPTSAEIDAELTAYLPFVTSLVSGPDGALYAAWGGTIWKVDPGRQVSALVTVQNGPNAETAPMVLDRSLRVAALAVGPNGDLFFTDDRSQRVYRLRQPQACPLPLRPEIALEGVRHGASFVGPPARGSAATVAPGQILAIFGRRLGPSSLIGARLEDGRLTAELGGVRVLIDGRPAPLLFASSGQLGAIVPYATPLTEGVRRSILQVEAGGVISEPTMLRVVEAQPGIFTLDSSGTGPGAILNEDGSLNTVENPAQPGQIIVLWATGEGRTDPPGVDGLIATSPLPQPTLTVTAQVNGNPANIVYAGAAPGLTAGAMQVNLRLPPDLTRSGAVPVSIRVGETDSSRTRSVTVFVAP